MFGLLKQLVKGLEDTYQALMTQNDRKRAKEREDELASSLLSTHFAPSFLTLLAHLDNDFFPASLLLFRIELDNAFELKGTNVVQALDTLALEYFSAKEKLLQKQALFRPTVLEVIHFTGWPSFLPLGHSLCYSHFPRSP